MSGNSKTQTLDRRVRRSRMLLQKAFGELLAEKDFHSLTVQDIVKRADVNRTTFYAHFEDKYALLNFSVRETLQSMLSTGLPEARVVSLDNLQLLVLTVCEFMMQFSRHCYPSSRNDEHLMLLVVAQVHQFVDEVLLYWLKEVAIDSPVLSLPPEHIASTLSGVILGIAFPFRRSTHRQQLSREMADEIFTFLTPSLQTYFVGLTRG
jgi:AcrR family transcriptional regulator